MRFVKPGPVDGCFRAPSSKSEMQRAIAAAFLARGRSEITYHGLCEDSKAALSVVEALGASVHFAGDVLVIEGEGREPAAYLDCGESGLCLRMFAPIAALTAARGFLDRVRPAATTSAVSAANAVSAGSAPASPSSPSSATLMPANRPCSTP